MSRPDDRYPLPTPAQYADAYRRIRLAPHHANKPAVRVLTRAAIAVMCEAARLEAISHQRYTAQQQQANKARLKEAISYREAS